MTDISSNITNNSDNSIIRTFYNNPSKTWKTKNKPNRTILLISLKCNSAKTK